MAIIAISGRIGSGKDTVGKIIQYLIWNNGILTVKDIEILDNSGQVKYNAKIQTGWEIKKFAFKLKQIVSILTGISVEDLEKQEVKDRVLGEEWWMAKEDDGNMFPLLKYIPYSDIDKYNNRKFTPIKLTVRELLQQLGTDLLRDKLHPNVHINVLFADYKAIKGHSHKIQYVDVIDNVAQIDLSNKSFIMCQEDNRDINYEDCKLEDGILKVYNTNKIGVRYIDNSLPNWIITDCRFKNELQAVKERGGISIRVNRNIVRIDDETLKPIGVESDYTTKLLRESLSQFKHPSETSLDNSTFDYTIENNSTIEELINKVKEILIKEEII